MSVLHGLTLCHLQTTPQDTRIMNTSSLSRWPLFVQFLCSPHLKSPIRVRSPSKRSRFKDPSCDDLWGQNSTNSTISVHNVVEPSSLGGARMYPHFPIMILSMS